MLCPSCSLILTSTLNTDGLSIQNSHGVNGLDKSSPDLSLNSSLILAMRNSFLPLLNIDPYAPIVDSNPRSAGVLLSSVDAFVSDVNLMVSGSAAQHVIPSLTHSSRGLRNKLKPVLRNSHPSSSKKKRIKALYTSIKKK